jgi:hypothetical protein
MPTTVGVPQRESMLAGMEEPGKSGSPFLFEPSAAARKNQKSEKGAEAQQQNSREAAADNSREAAAETEQSAADRGQQCR